MMPENERTSSSSEKKCMESMAVMTGYGIRIYVCHRPPHDDGSWHEELYREDIGHSSGYSWAPEPVVSKGGVPYTAFTTDRPRRGGKTSILARVTGQSYGGDATRAERRAADRERVWATFAGAQQRAADIVAETKAWDEHCESVLDIVHPGHALTPGNPYLDFGDDQ